MQTRDTLNRLREKERETRKTIIMDAARALFAQKEYDKVSMEQIAHAAGIGKSSIYTYFKNQEGLFTEIVCRDMASFIRQLNTILEQDPSNPVEAVIEFFIECYTFNRQQLHMILGFMLSGEGSQNSSGELNRLSRQLLGLLDEVFKRARYLGDIRFLSHTLLSILNGIVMSHYHSPRRNGQKFEAEMRKIGRKVGAMFRVLKESHLDKENESH